jgi:hypothetical protein
MLDGISLQGLDTPAELVAGDLTRRESGNQFQQERGLRHDGLQRGEINPQISVFHRIAPTIAWTPHP